MLKCSSQPIEVCKPSVCQLHTDAKHTVQKQANKTIALLLIILWSVWVGLSRWPLWSPGRPFSQLSQTQLEGTAGQRCFSCGVSEPWLALVRLSPWVSSQQFTLCSQSPNRTKEEKQWLTSVSQLCSTNSMSANNKFKGRRVAELLKEQFADSH